MTLYPSIAAVEADSIIAAETVIETEGYYEAGDGGGAHYKRVATEPLHELKIQSADGAWWEINELEINVLQAGAKDDAFWMNIANNLPGGTDSTQAIQNALDAHTYFNKGSCVNFPVVRTGLYLTTKTIHCGYGGGPITAFSTTRVYGKPNSSNKGPTIICKFSNAPGVAHQGCRGNVWSGVGLHGMQWGYIYRNHLFNGTRGTTLFIEDDTVVENCIDPELDPNANGQFTPYCGHAIDPYSSPAPTPSYPTVTYPDWFGSQDQYNKTHSSFVRIEESWIEGFVVGVAIDPTATDGNGDFVYIRYNVFQNNLYGVSMGNSQGRNVIRESNNYNLHHTVLTNIKHGLRNGAIVGPSINENIGNVIKILDVASTATAGPIEYLNLYTEALWSIGDFGGGSSSETGVNFSSCKFSFEAQGTGNETEGFFRSIPARILNMAPQITSVRFDNCSFTNSHSVNAIGPAAIVEMSNCLMNSTQVERTELYEKYAHNCTRGGLVINTPADSRRDYGTKHNTFNVNTGAAFGIYALNAGRPTYCANASTIDMYSTKAGAVTNFAVDRGFDIEKSPYVIDKATWTFISDENLILTFQVNLTAPTFMTRLMPGDVMVDSLTSTVWFVFSVDPATKTVKAKRQNNFKDTRNGTYSYPVPVNYTGSTIYVACSRMYTPTLVTLGDFEAGSANITNVGTPTGVNSYVATEIPVGDMMVCDRATDFLVNDDTSTVNVSGSTMTLGAVANYTAPRRRLKMFIKAGPPNITLPTGQGLIV